jgi:23S rRNA (adenine-N6)-dimethyltransferase
VAARRERHWGWHRLSDVWAVRLVAAAALRAGDLVLDVGAGDGALTNVLVRVGVNVVAVELHPSRAAVLRKRFERSEVLVVQADAADLWLPRQPFKVVANPPFSAVMALVRRLVAPGSRLITADLVVPRHIARRLCEGGLPGARRWQAEYTFSVGLRVPGRAFVPPAQRDAIVLRIRRRVVDAASAQRDPPID